MQGIFKLLGRFCRDERGAFLAIFGVMAIVVVATSGAVVDFIAVENTRSRAQVALDSVILALQPSIDTAELEDLRSQAEAFLIEQIDDPRVSVSISIDDVDVNTTDGTLYLKAEVDIPTSFVSLVGVDQLSASVVSKATQKKLFVEVAMVLDNSISMNDGGGDRIDALIAGAKSATNILFDGEETSENTKIGIVPFTWFVNVGADKATASWIDRAGLAPISRHNFDDDDDESTDYTDPMYPDNTRLALYDAMSGVSWQGCVEAREGDYAVNDATPPNVDTSFPIDPAGDVLTTDEASKLFTPAFAPDERDSSGSYSNSYLSDDPLNCQTQETVLCTWTQTYDGCNQWGNSCDWGSDNDYVAEYPDGTIDSSWGACSCSGETILTEVGPTITGPFGWHGDYDKTFVRTCNDTVTTSVLSSLSTKERQERLCKYEGSSASFGNLRGPNTDCPSEPILPLSDNRTTIDGVIDQMAPEGGTNIHQGAIWGYHMLSPTEPFTEGRAYDEPVYKVMILMTDGENSYWDRNNINGNDYYTAYGNLSNGRLGTYGVDDDDSMQVLIDGLTVDTCNNAKADGIDIFTIGLDPPNQDTRDMLIACATNPSQAHFPIENSELGAVFEAIANQLAELRLSL